MPYDYIAAYLMPMPTDRSHFVCASCGRRWQLTSIRVAESAPVLALLVCPACELADDAAEGLTLAVPPL